MTTVEQLETVDITKLNAIAAGTNKKVPRVVAAGLGMVNGYLRFS